MNLLQHFTAFIREHHLFQPNDKLLLAVSGGADSAVLAALCKEAGFDFAIAHCNFHLRGEESDRDEAFVKEMAKKYTVKLHTAGFDTGSEAKKNKTSVEETARNLRYHWFSELLAEYSYRWLLTAHHADDNIETVLMKFFRGTGIKGLRGIQPKHNNIVRPLLFARRKEIETYAAENNIEFVTDSSNRENDYARNFFRNEVIPAVRKVYPEAETNILRNIDRFSETEVVYTEAIMQMKNKLIEKRGTDHYIPVLKLVKSEPLNSLLYEIIADYGFSAAQTDEVKKLLHAESGKYIFSSSHRILRNRNWLIISPTETADNSAFFLVEKETGRISFPAGELKIEYADVPADLQAGADTAYIDAAGLKYPLILRKWKTGDYFYPLGMKKKKKLSRFFSDEKFSLIDKENTWLLESDKKIIWIISRRIDDRFKITSSTKDTLKLHLARFDH